MNLRILVAGGGSGGHLYPALAILEGFRARGAERLGYIGARRELERRVLSGYPWIEAYLIHGRGLPRPRPRGRGHTPSWSWRGLFPLGELFLGLIESLIIIFRFRPTVLIGTGGFVSFPPLLWGLIFRIPTVILEVNVIPGLVNRLLAPHVGLVTTAYPETARLLCRSRRAKKLAVTGVPLRPSVLAAAGLSPEESRRALGLDPHKRTVLILGGSRGAGPLNRAVLRSCSREGSNSDNFQVLLISGQDEGEGGPLRRGEGNQGWSVSVRGNGPIVQVRGYLDRIGEALSAADLVISRAGAATLAELTALGKPAILIPWPGAAENHQLENALLLERAGGAVLLPERLLEEVDLLKLARELLSEGERLERMALRSRALGRRDSLERFIEEVERYLADY